jgi:glycosyltransferase involved in cell wall biosynthesis
MARKFQELRDKMKKIKILAYCDSPTCATGFGTVSRNILSGLYATGKYDIDILGINYWGDPHGFPFRIWPVGINAERDPYGRKKIFNMIQQMDFDVLFFLQDSFIMDFLPELHKQLRAKGKEFRSICYYPVDGVPKAQWLNNVNACDYVVAYSEFGKQQSKDVLPAMKDLLVIPHGANTKDYFVASEKDTRAFRSQFFASQADKFVFTNLNRNQQRKDIPRTIAAFNEFHKQVPNSLLYLHMAKKDQGWDLPEIVKAYGLSTSEDVIFPENFGPNQGYPRNIVNMIYNISDCVVSTTLGEG